MRRRTAPRGLTLVEVMVAMVIVAVATLALVSANTIAARYSSRSYRHHVAMRLAQQRLEVLTLGDQKQKLRPASSGKFAEDGSPSDCQETGKPAELCSGAQVQLLGWVDIYGRPCRRNGTPETGYHPTCQYRRYVSYQQLASGTTAGDMWRVSIAVSHASDGQCRNTLEGDSECVVTSAVLTR